MTDARQWLRECSVTVGKAGAGLYVDSHRIQFEVVKTVHAQPNEAIIRIFNMHPDAETKIRTEYDDVILNAGYKGSARLIFRGNVRHVYRYRDKTDWIVEIHAGDGDKAYRNAYINATFAAGTTDDHVVEKAVEAMPGVSRGASRTRAGGRVRGKVVSAPVRAVLADLARQAGANWSIQNGALEIVGAREMLPGEAIVINSETGMLSAPEINDKGIAVKCQLNPEIRPNGPIKLDNESIKPRRKRIGKTENTKENVLQLELSQDKATRVDPDGLYKVIRLSHRGDTLSVDADSWITEIECVAIGAPIPSAKGK